MLLGGCTLGNLLKTNDAATDVKPGTPIATTTPAPTTSPDVSLKAIPSTTTATDVTSLENDINNTQVLDEDFSDLN